MFGARPRSLGGKSARALSLAAPALTWLVRSHSLTERARKWRVGAPALTWRTPALGAHALIRRRCGGGRGRVVWGAADAGPLRRPPAQPQHYAASAGGDWHTGCIWSWAPVAGVFGPCWSAFSSPAARGACLAAFFRARTSRRVAVASLCESGEIRSREQRGTRRTRGRARAGRGRSTFRSVLASARARLFSPSAPNMPRRNHEDSRLAARWEKSRNCGLSARPPGSGSQASCSQFRIMYAVHWWDCTNHTTGIEMEGLSCGRRVIAFDMLQKAITQTTA